MSAEDREFAVVFDPKYGWWSAACGRCGAEVSHKGFASAFAFFARHKNCTRPVTDEADS